MYKVICIFICAILSIINCPTEVFADSIDRLTDELIESRYNLNRIEREQRYNQYRQNSQNQLNSMQQDFQNYSDNLVNQSLNYLKMQQQNDDKELSLFSSLSKQEKKNYINSLTTQQLVDFELMIYRNLSLDERKNAYVHLSSATQNELERQEQVSQENMEKSKAFDDQMNNMMQQMMKNNQDNLNYYYIMSTPGW